VVAHQDVGGEAITKPWCHGISKIRNVPCIKIKNDQRFKLFGTRFEMAYSLNRNGNAPFQAEGGDSDD
jgi:hypothetical protein